MSPLGVRKAGTVYGSGVSYVLTFLKWVHTFRVKTNKAVFVHLYQAIKLGTLRQWWDLSAAHWFRLTRVSPLPLAGQWIQVCFGWLSRLQVRLALLFKERPWWRPMRSDNITVNIKTNRSWSDHKINIEYLHSHATNHQSHCTLKAKQTVFITNHGLKFKAPFFF